VTLRHVLLEPTRASVGTQAKGNNAQAEEHRRTWEREMERAQLAAWPPQKPLQASAAPDVSQLSSVGRATPVVRSRSDTDQHASPDAPAAKPASERTERLAEALRGFGRVLAMETTALAPASGPAFDAEFDPLALDAREDLIDFDPVCAGTTTPGHIASDLPAVATHWSASELGAPLRPAAAAVLQQAENPSIRLHADWAAEGVRLWLGLDSSVLGHMAAIVDQVRQCMRGQGVRLLSLACNGQLVEDDAATTSDNKETMSGPTTPSEPKENKPWPSVQ